MKSTIDKSGFSLPLTVPMAAVGSILLLSLVIDLIPRFHLGDSVTFIYTRYGTFIPENRSWTYGLALGWITRTTAQLIAMPLLQIFFSWAAYGLFASAVVVSLGLRRWAALPILAVGCLEPLGYFWSRSFMSDSPAQSAFVLLCAALIPRFGAAARFVLVFIVGFVLISLRVVYFPATLLALAGARPRSLWAARRRAAPNPGGDGTDHTARSWAAAVAALLLANLSYAVVNTHMTHGHKLSTNIGDMEFLVGALSPLAGDQLDKTPLSGAERAALLPLTYENRLGNTFSSNGLTPMIRQHFSSVEAARPAMQRLVVQTVLHHPIGVARLTARQWLDYVNPILVWTYHRRGWWSGAVPYKQGADLPDSLIQTFEEWKVWPTPTPDLPSRQSASLWYFKRFGGVWSLILSFYATSSIFFIFLTPKKSRTAFLIFACLFSFLYLGAITCAANELVTRYLLPLVAPLLYTAALGVSAYLRRAEEHEPRLALAAAQLPRSGGPPPIA